MIYYSKTHEYLNVTEGRTAYVGISPYAAKQLGNVVYVDLPEEGEEFQKGEEFGAIESVKAASDLYAPADMVILEVNEDLADNPRLVNDDPIANYLVKVEITSENAFEGLMDQAAYDAYCAEGH